MVDLSTNFPLVNSLIRTSGVQDGEIKLKWALKRINYNKISNKMSFIMYYKPCDAEVLVLTVRNCHFTIFSVHF